jgi:hypothetical protein
MMNDTTLPVPTGAVDVGGWRLDGGNARRFWGSVRVVKTQYGPDVYLELTGYQYRDGRIDRHVSINNDVLLYADEARQLAAQLLAVADEMEAAQ